jgi:hypothetical protein
MVAMLPVMWIKFKLPPSSADKPEETIDPDAEMTADPSPAAS